MNLVLGLLDLHLAQMKCHWKAGEHGIKLKFLPIYTHTHTHTHMYTHTHAYTYTHIYIYIFIFIFMYLYFYEFSLVFTSLEFLCSEPIKLKLVMRCVSNDILFLSIRCHLVTI